MSELLNSSAFFALAISLAGYELGSFLKKKTGLALFNPLLIAIVTVMMILLLFHIDYETYEEGSSILNYLLTPSMVALAIPLYRQLEVLKKKRDCHWSRGAVRCPDGAVFHASSSPCFRNVP